MLAEMDIVVFVQSHDDLAQTAQRVFGALGSRYDLGDSDEWGGPYAEAEGAGFSMVLFRNGGELQDPEFERYGYSLEMTSRYWCVDIEDELEGMLSDFYARHLAFELNLETATEILMDQTDEGEVFEIRAYRRNPQFRMDQAPTNPRVFVVETRQVLESYGDEDEWEDELVAEDRSFDEDAEPGG